MILLEVVLANYGRPSTGGYSFVTPSYSPKNTVLTLGYRYGDGLITISKANNPPNIPVILTPKANGYNINKRCPVIINIPTDADGNTVQVRATFKNGSTQLCQVTSSFVIQGSGTIKLTPTVDLPVGTITVILDAYDGTEWSTTNTYTFIIVQSPNFTVINIDNNISKTNMDNLKLLLLNIRLSRNLDGVTDFIGNITKNQTVITKSHLDLMRSKTSDVLSIIGIIPTWTDPIVTVNETIRKGIHWIEIFNYLKQC